jgi:hypothetical protein
VIIVVCGRVKAERKGHRYLRTYFRLSLVSNILQMKSQLERQTLGSCKLKGKDSKAKQSLQCILPQSGKEARIGSFF